MANQSKALAVNNVSPGSQPLRNRVYERYARYRAQYLPRHEAWKQALRTAFSGRPTQQQTRSAYERGYRLERNEQINQRIQYLSKDEVETIRSKRQRLEEALWSQHEADIGDYFEQTAAGVEQPKRLADLDPAVRRNIEKVVIDAKGRIFPQLYNKQNASKELRAMLAIGRAADAGPSLSDAELVSQLSEQAKQLGIEIDLNFRFAQPSNGTPSGTLDDDASDSASIVNSLDDKSAS